MYDVILAWRREGRIAADRDNSPKARAPKTASELWELVSRPEARGNREAGCYELSALYIAMARAAGLKAVGVERRAHVDTGQIGHVMAGVWLGRRLVIYDLQNEIAGSTVPYREIDDATLAAHHYNHLAVAAYLAQELPRARQAIDVALGLSPEGPAFLSNRATVLLAQGEPHLAAADAARAVELQPEVPIYRYGLGRALLEGGDAPGARRQLEEALRLRSSYELARRDLGWVLLLLGERPAGLLALERAAEARPPVPDAALFLGLGRLAGGEKQAAIAAFDRGLRDAPGDVRLSAGVALATGKGSPSLAPEVKRLAQVLATVTPPPPR